LSVAELSLHEFLLDQILFLQESLEPWLVPRIVEELLGRERVSPPWTRTSHVLRLWWGGEGQGDGGAISGRSHPWSSISGSLSGGSSSNQGAGPLIVVSGVGHQLILRLGCHDTVHLVCEVLWKGGKVLQSEAT
jgi:hypothetical protein